MNLFSYWRFLTLCVLQLLMKKKTAVVKKVVFRTGVPEGLVRALIMCLQLSMYHLPIVSVPEGLVRASLIMASCQASSFLFVVMSSILNRV